MGGKLTDDFILYGEIIIGGEKDLLLCNEGLNNFFLKFILFIFFKILDITMVLGLQKNYMKMV
jgi:hypothetical protein